MKWAKLYSFFIFREEKMPWKDVHLYCFSGYNIMPPFLSFLPFFFSPFEKNYLNGSSSLCIHLTAIYRVPPRAQPCARQCDWADGTELTIIGRGTHQSKSITLLQNKIALQNEHRYERYMEWVHFGWQSPCSQTKMEMRFKLRNSQPCEEHLGKRNTLWGPGREQKWIL